MIEGERNLILLGGGSVLSLLFGFLGRLEPSLPGSKSVSSCSVGRRRIRRDFACGRRGFVGGRSDPSAVSECGMAVDLELALDLTVGVDEGAVKDLSSPSPTLRVDSDMPRA